MTLKSIVLVSCILWVITRGALKVLRQHFKPRIPIIRFWGPRDNIVDRKARAPARIGPLEGIRAKTEFRGEVMRVSYFQPNLWVYFTSRTLCIVRDEPTRMRERTNCETVCISESRGRRGLAHPSFDSSPPPQQFRPPPFSPYSPYFRS